MIRPRPLPLAIPPLVLVLGLAVAACGDAPDRAPVPSDENPAHRIPDPLTVPQAVSLLGEELYAMEDTVGMIAEADSALAGSPDDVELLIEAGRVRRHFWHYRQAMALYSRAAELAPDDWRPYRFRGHRHISLRNFDEGIRDLERARELAPLNWDVSYHLALAYFLAGRFEEAADEYLRCLNLAEDEAAREAHGPDFRSCAANARDPESRTAMTEWAVRALVRAGRDDEALRLLEAYPSDLPVEVNLAYHHNLLYGKGEMAEEDLVAPGDDAPYRLETVGFGVANWMLARGDTARAREILERLAADPWWPGFGRLAAEAELARMP